MDEVTLYVNDYGKYTWTTDVNIKQVLEVSELVPNELIKKSFKLTGISNNLDGSEYHKLSSQIRELLSSIRYMKLFLLIVKIIVVEIVT
jgi:hypothetical protein